jgi:folylpolyglutamate synthase
MNRTYNDALEHLTLLQSNRSITNLFTPSPKTADLNNLAIPEVEAWFGRAGHTPVDLARLRCIHVAGTKGKGSVCAYVSSILRQYPSEAGKVGLFTSPHLVSVRERIVLNGQPISQELFAKYFFEVWDTLSQAAAEAGEKIPAELGGIDGPRTKPFYFRFLLIMAIHVFLREGIKSAVIECGIGGEYDATNILPPEAVSASVVAQLGIDHVNMLGDTVEKIAWHKAGIFKKNVPAFTRKLDAQPSVMEVLRNRAEEKSTKLVEIDDADIDAWGGASGCRLAGDFQKYNQALSIAAARAHLGLENDMGQSVLDDLPEPFLEGLRTAQLRGRHERIQENNIEWFLDGAHTSDSLEQVGQWFAKEALSGSSVNLLVFNQQERDASALLTELLRVIKDKSGNQSSEIFEHAIFSRNDQFPAVDGSEPRDLGVQTNAAKAMEGFSESTEISIFDNIEAAAAKIRGIATAPETAGKKLHVLGTGSLYLVGGLLRAIEPDSLL